MGVLEVYKLPEGGELFETVTVVTAHPPKEGKQDQRFGQLGRQWVEYLKIFVSLFQPTTVVSKKFHQTWHTMAWQFDEISSNLAVWFV